MPDKTKTPPAAIDRSALYSLIRFIFSMASLVTLAIADLNNDRDTIPTVVYLLIGALNGVDIYSLVKSVKN